MHLYALINSKNENHRVCSFSFENRFLTDLNSVCFVGASNSWSSTHLPYKQEQMLQECSITLLCFTEYNTGRKSPLMARRATWTEVDLPSQFLFFGMVKISNQERHLILWELMRRWIKSPSDPSHTLKEKRAPEDELIE